MYDISQKNDFFSRCQRIWKGRGSSDDDDDCVDDDSDEDGNLKVLGLGEVEECEGAKGDEKGSNIHPVGIPPRHWASLSNFISKTG